MSKISELPEISYPFEDGDYIPIVREGTTYKADPKKLFQGYLKFVPGFEGYVILAAAENTNGAIVQEDDILIGRGAYQSGNYVMMRALQDNPTLDEHFKIGIQGNEF